MSNREFELYYSSKVERTELVSAKGVVNYCIYDTQDTLFAALQIFRRYDTREPLRILDVEDGSDTMILLLINQEFNSEQYVEKCNEEKQDA